MVSNKIIWGISFLISTNWLNPLKTDLERDKLVSEYHLETKPMTISECISSSYNHHKILLILWKKKTGVWCASNEYTSVCPVLWRICGGHTAVCYCTLYLLIYILCTILSKTLCYIYRYIYGQRFDYNYKGWIHRVHETFSEDFKNFWAISQNLQKIFYIYKNYKDNLSSPNIKCENCTVHGKRIFPQKIVNLN